jgi:hypothetical protein
MCNVNSLGKTIKRINSWEIQNPTFIRKTRNTYFNFPSDHGIGT